MVYITWKLEFEKKIFMIWASCNWAIDLGRRLTRVFGGIKHLGQYENSPLCRVSFCSASVSQRHKWVPSTVSVPSEGLYTYDLEIRRGTTTHYGMLYSTMHFFFFLFCRSEKILSIKTVVSKGREAGLSKLLRELDLLRRRDEDDRK